MAAADCGRVRRDPRAAPRAVSRRSALHSSTRTTRRGRRRFSARLERASELETARTTRAEAEESVRTGGRRAFISVPSGFGAASERLFYGAPPTVELGLDPSRTAESGMLEGVLMKYGMQGLQQVLSDPEAGHRAVESALKTLPARRSARTPRWPRRRRSLGNWTSTCSVTGAVEPRAASTPGASGGDGWTPLQVVKREVTGARAGTA